MYPSENYHHREYHMHFGFHMHDILEVRVYIDPKLDIKEFLITFDANQK
jgi:hypothetical protein